MMNNTSNTNTVKRGRGRPRKDTVANITNKNKPIDNSIPALLEPNIHDIHDELVRMDSFAYSRYNE
jgi:hypothetical protein